jgi:hypothetical protein
MTKSTLIMNSKELKVAQDIIALSDEFRKREEELRNRFQVEINKLSAEFNQRKNFLWDNLIEMTGLTPKDEKGERSGFTICYEFFDDHGMMFILHPDFELELEEEVCDSPTSLALHG